jgi:hypothetical protein
MPQMPGNSSCRRPSAVTTWVTGGTIQPGADDFTMLWLHAVQDVPQVGGLVLMPAASARR